MMNKTSTIWVIAAFCAMIIITALGVVTYRLVQKDRTQIANAYEADKQGRIRVAMWRMDTLAASIIQEEDERSVYEFNNPEMLPLPDQSLKNQANRLYYNSPDTTNLYWNIVPRNDSEIISPQVYNTGYLDRNGIDKKLNVGNKRKLNELEKILAEKSTEASSQYLPGSDFKSLTCAVAQISLEQWGAAQEATNQNYAQNNNFSYKGQTLDKVAVQKKNEPESQERFSNVDKGVRAKALSRIKSSKESSWNMKQQEQKQENMSKEAPVKKEKSPSKSPSKLLPKTKVVQETKSPGVVLPEPANQNPFLLEEPFSTPFTPVWINSELMLVRKVSEPTGDIVQGVWINSDKLVEKMLAEIADLFPDAELLPVEQNIDHFLSGAKTTADYLTMVKFPLRLKTNEYKSLNTSFTSYFRGPIGLAWLGAFFAILASFFMLRSVLNMSERRASFVSSVTHELRTPLTTFRLYSDLLATGMVQNEEKRQTYLGTLKHEAERLTHLVDNVLSYSQIEKGSAKAKIESISISSLMSRMESRLSERATEDLMLINIIYTSEIGEQNIRVDITAVEQIIFNLIDNACKYASGEDYGDQIDVKITSNQKSFFFQVCDDGPGIDVKESKRLFRPFHKSAKEAADTKPGVGLGLALCKRLARAMKGDLTVGPSEDTSGACFQLTLPKSKD